jgi:hypothetical protein
MGGGRHVLRARFCIISSHHASTIWQMHRLLDTVSRIYVRYLSHAMLTHTRYVLGRDAPEVPAAWQHVRCARFSREFRALSSDRPADRAALDTYPSLQLPSPH